MGCRVAKTFNEILKFNPYHDSLGRFTTAGGASSFTIRTKDPKKQYLADLSIARAKEQDANSVTSTATATAQKPNRTATEKPQSETETPRMKQIHDIEDKIRKQPFESAALVDNDGNMLYFKDGMESEVGFTQAECTQMRGNTLTHNHPRCSMFSKEDLQCMAANGLYEIRATNRDGTTYSMKQAKKGYSANDALTFADAYGMEYKSATQHAQNDLNNNGYVSKVLSGEISMVQANIEFGRAIAKYMVDWTKEYASHYGLEFSVDEREVKKTYFRGDILKSATTDHDKDDYLILDRETNDLEDKAFKEWLDRAVKGVSTDETTNNS